MAVDLSSDGARLQPPPRSQAQENGAPRLSHPQPRSQGFLPRVPRGALVPPRCRRSGRGCGYTTRYVAVCPVTVPTISRCPCGQVIPLEADAYLALYGGRLLGGTPPNSQTMSSTLMANCLAVGLTATVFGFDYGGTSGALQNLTHYGGLPMDHVGPLLEGWIVASVWLGNFAGTLFAYYVPNSRTLLMLSGVMNAAGGLCAWLAPNLSVLITGRILSGIGNGYVCVSLSQYLGEIAPPTSRGGAIACLETSLIMGAVAGAIVARVWIKAYGGWRRIWGLTCPLGILAFVVMLRMPNTPRAIFGKMMSAARRGELEVAGDSGGTGADGIDPLRQREVALQVARSQALEVLCQMRGLREPDEALIAEVDDIQAYYAEDDRATGSQDVAARAAEIKDLSLMEILASPAHRRLLFASAVAAATPALVGHPAMMTYGTQMFKSVGYDMADGASLAVVLQLLKLAVTLPDFLWLDAMPRRALMACGNAAVVFSYAATILAVHMHSPAGAAVGILMSAAAYQASVGPMSWILPAEILTVDMKCRGASFSSSVSASASLLVVELHPVVARSGPVAVLACYIAGATASMALNYCVLPETQGLTLEAISRGGFQQQLQHSPRDSPPASSPGSPRHERERARGDVDV